MSDGDSGMSPTWLAAALGVGLIVLVFALNLLAPGEAPVDLARLEALVAEGSVAQIEVGRTDIVAHLTRAVAIDDMGQRRLASAVVTDRLAPGADEAVARWTAAGYAVARSQEADDDRQRREWGWVAAIVGLLGFGLYYLVGQARRHRVEGSPRQRLDEARVELESGRISPEEYERRVAEISVEL